VNSAPLRNQSIFLRRRREASAHFRRPTPLWLRIYRVWPNVPGTRQTGDGGQMTSQRPSDLLAAASALGNEIRDLILRKCGKSMPASDRLLGHPYDDPKSVWSVIASDPCSPCEDSGTRLKSTLAPVRIVEPGCWKRRVPTTVRFERRMREGTSEWMKQILWSCIRATSHDGFWHCNAAVH
jgi:hypothetical protein